MDLDMDGDIVHVGALVDEVVAVLEIDDNQIKPPPSIGNTYSTEFITGVANIDEKFIMILDMEKIFSTTEISELKSTGGNKENQEAENKKEKKEEKGEDKKKEEVK